MLLVTAAFDFRSIEVPTEAIESRLVCLAIRDKAGHLEATLRELAAAPAMTRATSSEAEEEEVAVESRVVGELPATATPPAAALASAVAATGAAADADDDEKVNSSLLAKLLLLRLFVEAELEIETEAELEAEFEPEPEQEVLALTWQMLFEVFASVETSAD